jgi:regulator of protease activity HflC (stomatin/prohibitin superfamily)
MRWIVLSLVACAGCGAVIEPGHRGLLFNSRHGGLQHDVLGPGYHKVGLYGRIDDFDVTYSTHHEQLHVSSQEGAQLDVKLSLIYRPIVSELYDLDVEIGPNYYDEVVGPEFKTAIRGMFARHSYLGLLGQNEKFENEIEDELKRRIAGKHVEISSVTMEEINCSPELVASVQARLLGEQERLRKNEALKHENEMAQIRAEAQRKLADALAEAELAKKKHEQEVAEAQAALEKTQAQAAAEKDKIETESEAENKVVAAKAEAQALTVLAKAHAEEKKAEAVALTPLAVMMHAYDALGKLGGTNTTFMLGDFSKVPQMLFPRIPQFKSLFGAPLASN